MIKVWRSTPDDIIEAIEDALPVYAGDKGLYEGMSNALERGRLYTIGKADGTVLGVIGGVLIWQGVASVGAILTNQIQGSPISVVRVTKRIIETVMRDHKIHRMEMAVRCGYPVGQRWAEGLGFQAEGILRQYGEDRADYTMYGKVK